MTHLLVLVLNDLGIAFKNKSFFLIIFIPLFVVGSLKLAEGVDAGSRPLTIGLIQREAYPPGIVQSIEASSTVVQLTWVQDQMQGVRLLKDHTLDAILTKDEKAAGGLVLVVLKAYSLKTLAIVQLFSSLQKATRSDRTDWITNIQSLHQGGVQRETLPTWILMLVLLVGFVILPAQVAEEKEKKLLLALLQAPIPEMLWLLAKVVLGMVLIFSGVVLLQLLSRFPPPHLFDYLVLLVAGSFCFSAYGVLLGFLCRTQASARTLGMIFYLPHLLPSALSDVSQPLGAVAPFLPSYWLFNPLQALLLEEGRLADMPFDWIGLFLLGSLMIGASYRLMKRRWLM